MRLIILQTAMLIGESGYREWQGNKDARPHPVLKRIYLKKEITDVTIAPLVGEALSDGLWKNHPYEVSMKHFDYDKDECSITLKPTYIPENSPLERECEQRIVENGWEVIGIGEGD